jgi:hypothetical protein
MDDNIMGDHVTEAHADRSYNDTNSTNFQLEQSDDSCSMQCHNGGTCQQGRPIHGFAAELLEDEDTLHFGIYNPIEHCVCPTGWTGLHCEVKLVKCPSAGVCFNGKKCILAQDDFGKPFRHCECSAKESDFTLPYAAHFCGQTASVFCGATHSFCKNGGKCLGTVKSQAQPHPGCECTEGWEGPTCAHLVGTYPQRQPVEQGDKIAFSLFGFGVASLIIGIVVWFNRKRRAHRAAAVLPPKKKGATTHDYDAFLDEYESSNDYHGDSEENFSLSRSYSDFDNVSDSEDEESDKEENGDGERNEEEDTYGSEIDLEYHAGGMGASPLYSDPEISSKVRREIL